MEITTLDIVTLVVAVFGALLGLAALVWNIAEFRLAGPRVKVAIKAAVISKAMEDAITGLEAVWTQNFDPRINERAVAIWVRNVGRFPTSIETYRVDVAEGYAFTDTQSLVGPPVPHRLEAGEAATWYIGFDAVRAAKGAVEDTMKLKDRPLRASVFLGDGRRIESEDSLTIPSSLSQ